MNAYTTDGPARSAMAAAVRTNNPAPMIAPMPRATRAKDPRVRLSPPSSVPAPLAIRRSIDLVRNIEPATPLLLGVLWSSLGKSEHFVAGSAPRELYANIGPSAAQVN